MTFGAKVIRYLKQLHYTGKPLPKNVRIMNPFEESEQVKRIVKDFYTKYYSDDQPRHLVVGINPGRFGSGNTGIPFTDPKRLVSECNIMYEGKMTHEPSSVFVYAMIRAYGGIGAFCKNFYINSVCPLGFTFITDKGQEKNYNYYDSNELINSSKDFIIENIRKQIALGIKRDVCFCLGVRNADFLKKLNDQHHFFNEIVVLEHPRFVMQYKLKSVDSYVQKYISAFESINNQTPK